MHFLLTTLKVVYVLSTPSPVWSENETLEMTRKRMKWENDDYICHGHILNGMSDSLFDVYQNAESVKALWEPVIEQYHEILRILGQYTQHILMMDEAISVVVIIDKLPPSWKEFKHGLKHKKEELNLVQLGSHLRIEEGLKNQELDNNPKGKNQITSSYDDEVAWWVDSGVTSYVCKDLRWFQVCKSIEDGSFVKMGNVATKPIKGIGRVLLTFSFGKPLCLDNVLFYVIEPKDYVSVNSIIESRDAIIDEKRFTSIHRPRCMIHPSSSKIAEDEVEGTRDKTLSQREYCFIIEEDPRTLSKAMASLDELTDLPPGCKSLGCKWILKTKMKVDGNIDKYKARLVIQGFRQKEGIDFFFTYAHVARISTIRLLLALVAK
nr:zinc finger, CCHC-type [Tanacetum cinerariifolium]